MNDDQPDKLSEGRSPEFLAGRHSSVRRREPAAGGQDGRGPRLGGPDPWPSKGPGGVQGLQAPRLLFSTWKSLAAVRAREPGI